MYQSDAESKREKAHNPLPGEESRLLSLEYEGQRARVTVP